MVPGAICVTAMDTNALGMATSVQWKLSRHPLATSRDKAHLQSFQLQFLAKVLPQRSRRCP
jgi:hypothetical protein